MMNFLKKLGWERGGRGAGVRRALATVLGMAGLLLLSGVLLSGCAKDKGAKGPDPGIDEGGTGVLDKEFYSVRVLYGTNRASTGSTEPRLHFLSDVQEGITYGECEVTIPRGHRPGQLESPSILRLEFRENPKRHVILKGVEELEPDAWTALLQEKVGESESKECFVFIHGFKVSFEDAARRTAQMAFDLHYDGAPILFSWPSQNRLSLGGYRSDEEVAAASVAALKTFLMKVVAESGAERVNVVAHSMGNRVLAGALVQMALEMKEVPERPQFNQIVLAAPDLNADVYNDVVAPAMALVSNGVTLYASDHDRALIVSRLLNKARRLGETEPAIYIGPGMASIDASNADTNPLGLGHSYYAKVPAVMQDIGLVFQGKLPEQRSLVARGDESGRYWLIPGGEDPEGSSEPGAALEVMVPIQPETAGGE